MLGTDKEPGIMGRALNDLFSEMEGTKEEMTYRVSMSYLEVGYLGRFFNCCMLIVLQQNIVFIHPSHLRFQSVVIAQKNE